MAIRLFEHNRQAYEAAVAMFSEKQKAAIIHPTGTGKSFIGFQGDQRLLGIFSDAFVLGLSHYLNTQSDTHGILNPPKYVLSIYSYKKDFEKYKKRAASVESKAVRNRASLYLLGIVNNIENLCLDNDSPIKIIAEDDYALGSWLTAQRRVHSGKTNGILTDGQIEKLDKIDMCWNSVKNITWNKYYAATAYYNTYKSLDVNFKYIAADGFRLGAWLKNLRTQYRKDPKFVFGEQFHMLNSIGMRWGNKYDSEWDTILSPTAYKTQKAHGLAREYADKQIRIQKENLPPNALKN